MCYHVEFVFSASQGVGISREEAKHKIWEGLSPVTK